MTGMAVHVAGVPVPQGSKTVYRGRAVDANAALLRPWRQAVTAAANRALLAEPGAWPHLAPMRVQARFVFPRLKGHHRADGSLKASAPHVKATRPDLDKLLRACFDALTDAGVWADDAQVVSVQARKTYGDRPGLVVHITPSGEAAGEEEYRDAD